MIVTNLIPSKIIPLNKLFGNNSNLDNITNVRIFTGKVDDFVKNNGSRFYNM